MTGASTAVARQRTRTFVLMFAIFIGLLAVSLAASWGAIQVVNGTRAYATGEGLYSKAQKGAVLSLHLYARSRRASDYAAFLKAISVPRGDRAARLALEASHVDLSAARQGFLRGENNPADVGSLIWMFRLFGSWTPFADAVATWQKGDALVAKLLDKGRELHRLIRAGRLTPADHERILNDVDRIDSRLTALEITFSSYMGQAAREATTLVLAGLAIIMIVLWGIGTAFAARLLRRQLTLDQQLSLSEQRFRDYAEVASDWYWETDGDHRIVFLSERFLSSAGIDDHAIIGRPITELIDGSADNDASARARAALAAGRLFRDLHLRYTSQDGQPVYWSLSGKPLYDADGGFVGYRGVGTDITRSVNDAHALQQAKDSAEAANSAKSEFLANMSHELRTPLNAILGFSEMITSQLHGPDAMARYVEYASDIQTSGRHLLAVINDILDLSRIESGHSVLDEALVSVLNVVETVNVLLGDSFERAGLAWVIERPFPQLRLRIDKRKLTQALVNLLSNARKFTPKGGTVTLAVCPNAEGGLDFIVRDTGIGIAPELVPVALSPFGQIESAFSREHHGTGLGLPLACRLIELHGGRLNLTSQVNVGTTVILSLPKERLVSLSARDEASQGVDELAAE